MRFISISLALLTLMVGAAQAITEDDLLPADQAFAIETSAVDANTLKVAWTVAEGYYMYRSRISFKSMTEGIQLGEPVMPKGKEKVDEFFGKVETYRHRFEITVPITRLDPTLTRLELQARSQGCADLGVCYPPHRQNRTIELVAAAATLPVAATQSPFLSNSAGGLDLGTSSGLALDDQPLPEDQAFLFEALAMSSTEVLVRWTITEGYYLYRDQIAFEVDADSPIRLAEPNLPPGEDKTDEHFGAVKIYRGQIEVPLPIERLNSEAGSTALIGHYRGCKDNSICYPPIVRTLKLDLPAHDGALGDAAAARIVGAVAVIESAPQAGLIPPLPESSVTTPAQDLPIPEQDRLARALGEESLLTLLSFFGFGLLLAFTPCVFPMIPILSGIIAGQGENITTRKAFTLSLVYVLAMALTYTVAGVFAGLFGQNLQAAFQNAWVLGGFSLIFVLLALSMFGFYELQLPSALQTRLNAMSNRQQSGTLFGVAIMGFLSALIVGPCVAPPLAAALIYIGQSGDAVLGGLALFSLSMGMGAPLILIGVGAGRFLPRAGIWMDAVKAVFGVSLLGLALWMLERIADPTWIMFGWAALLSASGVYMGALERLADSASGWRKLWKSIGVMLLILGVLEFVGAASGGRDWLQPLKGVGGGAAPQSAQTVEFRLIKSVDDLDRILAASDRPVMLDFSAEWCVDCKRMEKYSFPEAPVQAALSGGLPVKADVTENDEIDQALMKRFNIIGPPAILFFDRNGQEMPQFRVVGYQSPEKFAKHVKAAFDRGSSL